MGLGSSLFFINICRRLSACGCAWFQLSAEGG